MYRDNGLQGGAAPTKDTVEVNVGKIVCWCACDAQKAALATTDHIVWSPGQRQMYQMCPFDLLVE